MNAKPGYKMTEVGEIPEEWELKRLGGIIDLLTGFPFPSLGYSQSGTRLLRGSNVKRNCIDWSEELTQYWPLITGDMRRYLLRAGDIVIAMDGSLVGQSFAVLKTDDVPALLLQRVARIRAEGVSQVYLKEWICSQYFTEHCDEVKTTTAIPHISPTDINNFIIPLPPTVAEQEAIAGALGDVDALIASLDRLVAKKRDVQQAAMQELLTGRTRLPGFSGEWEMKTFGSLFQFLKTANNARSDLTGDGEVGYIHYGDIHTHPSAFLDCSRTPLPHIAPGKVAGCPRVEEGDLVMADASEDYTGIGKCVEVTNLGDKKIVAGLHTFLLRGDKEQLADNFKGYLQFLPAVRSALVRLATGISVFGISKANVKSIEIALPPPAEQSAIAEVLTDMDAEIAAMEARREKTRLLKQGMMQELLTGRTRLT